MFNPAGAPSFRGEHLGDPVVALATMAPDIHRELQRFHVVGDVVAVEPAIQGTFTGPFNWPGGVIHPTGAKLDVPCADFWYIENGKIKEFNCHVSMDVMFRQMGGKLVFAGHQRHDSNHASQARKAEPAARPAATATTPAQARPSSPNTRATDKMSDLNVNIGAGQR